MRVLDLGLKYAPEKSLDPFEVFIDLQKFVRKLNIRKFFAIKGEQEPQKENEDSIYKHSKLKNNSTFNPNTQQNESLITFKKMVEQDIRKMNPRKTKSRVWKTIKGIEKKKNIVIRPADKGGGLVILNKQDYELEMGKLLNIPNTYKKLKGNPKVEYHKKLKAYIHKGEKKGILNKKEARYLIPETAKTPVIYYVPKIHKSQTNPPGRPIISGINGLFSRLGAYLDGYLQPLVIRGKSYLRDSKQLITELKNLNVKEEDILVTIDINSLYTNIVQTDGINGAEWALYQQTDLKEEQIKYLLEGLKLAMSHNYFWHKGDYYTQVKGVAMGAKYAPSIANLLLNKWEEEQIYSTNRSHLKFYRRYIDDIVIIWGGTEEELQMFFDELNHNIYGLSFSGNWSRRNINYLDLQIFKEDGHLSTKTHFKDTDRNGYIPTSSCHHPKWIGNIPKGQFMRIRRNCSNITDFEEQTNNLIKRFVDKGYKKRDLLTLKEQIKNMDRHKLMEATQNTHKRDKNKSLGLAFLTGYNTQYRSIESIVKKHWPILQSDQVLKTVLPKKPIFIYRKAATLRNKLVHNALDPPKQIKIGNNLKGFYKCGKCLPCRETKKTNKKIMKFKSTSNGKEYTIRDLITCNNTHVTYVLECPCRKQYVGRTTRKLHIRIREHVTNIKNGFKKHSVSRHFRDHHNRDPSGMLFYGIDKIKGHWRGDNKKTKVSQNETRWIFQLDTLQPSGMNIDVDLNCFLTNY